MFNTLRYQFGKFLALISVIALACDISLAQAMTVPHALVDTAPKATAQSIVLAGGCFWGMQSVYEHVKGVKATVAGYAGGTANTARYEVVGTGMTGHAESLQISYDPSQISLEQILKVYFLVAHHPTELDYQGSDIGTQYRSAVFVATPEQQKVVEETIAQLKQGKAFSSPIVTKIEALNGFYPAEAYHQNYAKLHPDMPYIRVFDLPKVSALQKKFPELYAD
jgi:peptide-methionine (S)-S-oxide reductase